METRQTGGLKAALESPRGYLIADVVASVAILLLARWLAVPGLGVVALMGGVIVAALWYPRWVYVTAIGLFELLALPLLIDFDSGVQAVRLYLFAVPLGLFVLAELIHRLIMDLQRANRYERIARAQLADVLADNPAIVYKLQGSADLAETQVAFLSANAVALLGEAVNQLEPRAAVTGLCGQLSEDERQAWQSALIGQGEATVEYAHRHPDGRTLWLRDTCRLVRTMEGAGVHVVGYVSDVTERHQYAARLSESESRLAEVIYNSPAVLYHAQPDPESPNGLRYIYHSANAADVVGLTPDDIGRTLEDWLARIHPEDRAAVLASTRAYAQSRSEDPAPLVVTYRVMGLDDRAIWLQDTLRATRQADGRVASIVGQCLNVTAQQEAAEALRRSEDRLRHIVRNSPLATYVQERPVAGDHRLRTTFVSDNIVELTGYTAPELLADTTLWTAQIHPDDRERLFQTHSGESGARAATVEYRFRHRDGRELWIEDTWHARLDESSGCIEYVGEVQDISERKVAQLRMAESQDFITQMASAVPSQVFVADLVHQRILYSNRAATTVMAYPQREEPGANLIQILGQDIHPDDLAAYADTIRGFAQLADDEILTAQFRVRDQAGAWRDLRFRYRAFKRDAAGRPTQILVVWDDVSDYCAAQRRLAENQRLLQRMTDAHPSSTFVIELSKVTGREAFVYANRMLPQLLGYGELPADEREGVTFLIRHMHPDDLAVWFTQIGRLDGLADGELLEQDYRVQAADGAWRWFHTRLLVLDRDPGGTVRQILGVMDDTTALHQAHADLESSQRLLSRIAEAVPNVLYVVNVKDQSANGGVLYSNRSLPVLLGYPSGLTYQKGWGPFLLEHLHPDNLARIADVWSHWRSLPDGEVFETEYQLRDVTGNWRWMRGRDLVFERDPDGSVSQIIGVIEDITAGKELQQEIQTQRDFAQLVLNTLGQGVAVLTASGVCEYLNPAGARLLGIDADAAIGVEVSQLLGVRTYEGLLDQWRHGVGAETVSTLEMRLSHGDGATDLLVTGSARLHRGERTGWVMVFTDVSERNAMAHALETTNAELERALTRAQELTRQAQAATRAKSDFLANMSHEIRTPMNAIVGMAELLLESEPTDEQQPRVQVIVDSGQALLEIINDILDFSKIEAGRFELDPHEFDVTALVEGATELLAARSTAKGLQLACFVDPEIPEKLVGDSGRLRQVLLNLLSNAVKFTAAGRVVVRAELESLSASTARVVIRVQDTGIGISPEAQARLFQPFEQAETSTARRYGGTGLGLALVRRLVDLMGGTVQLSSVPDVGTTVTLDVILLLAQNPQPVRTPGPAGRVLVCESDPIEREILERYLTAEGYAVRSYAEAADLAAHARQIADTDALIVGLWPSRTSTDWVQEILAANPTLRRTPRLVLTESGRSTDEREIGLARPIKRGSLTAGLRQALHGSSTTPAAPAPETHRVQVEHPERRQRVLLAEDNVVNQQVARLQLDKLGYDVEVVADGRAAVAAFEADPARYDLILMDCQMPVVDGFEATRQIRTWEGEHSPGTHVRIVAMTANAMAGDREICLAAGMDDYVSKPVNRQALADALMPAHRTGPASPAV